MALLLSLGIGALSVRALWTLRNDEWTYALKANTNLVGTLAHSLEWTLDSVDQSLITVVEGIESAGELSPSARMRDRLREVVRFESVVRLHALGNVVVINAQGDVILDSGS
ncbi:MAG: sensor domain-containing diguanylate cyclase, partial [Paenacidovorax caeni]